MLLALMAPFQLKIKIAVRVYHVYGEVRVPTVHEEFDCRQEADNRESKYAVAITEICRAVRTMLGHFVKFHANPSCS